MTGSYKKNDNMSFFRLTNDKDRHKMTPTMKQKDIAKILDRDPTEISRFLSGQRAPSWSLAIQLSKLLPARTVEQWKSATPKELKTAFIQIEAIKSLVEA